MEVLKNNYNGSIEGSLLHAMDRTSTSFGSRLLKHWVTHPLCDRNSIIARLDAVAEIAESMDSIEVHKRSFGRRKLLQCTCTNGNWFQYFSSYKDVGKVTRYPAGDSKNFS
ncbi:hypothetical protein HPP92_020486 [Vanilla planifolia]|uniref:DNA mismatch repair protein MutS core domain-containing protein n=1 Tax=Vanilla planifolia TaxID=51239 RepID=A0A835UIH8_VANPL|nr:hypothetical protein HPP92_020486 [Vanilla planifolia]